MSANYKKGCSWIIPCALPSTWKALKSLQIKWHVTQSIFHLLIHSCRKGYSCEFICRKQESISQFPEDLKICFSCLEKKFPTNKIHVRYIYLFLFFSTGLFMLLLYNYAIYNTHKNKKHLHVPFIRLSSLVCLIWVLRFLETIPILHFFYKEGTFSRT